MNFKIFFHNKFLFVFFPCKRNGTDGNRPLTLNIQQTFRNDVFLQEAADLEDTKKGMRRAAYRQYILWIYGQPTNTLAHQAITLASFVCSTALAGDVSSWTIGRHQSSSLEQLSAESCLDTIPSA